MTAALGKEGGDGSEAHGICSAQSERKGIRQWLSERRVDATGRGEGGSWTVMLLDLSHPARPSLLLPAASEACRASGSKKTARLGCTGTSWNGRGGSDMDMTQLTFRISMTVCLRSANRHLQLEVHFLNSATEKGSRAMSLLMLSEAQSAASLACFRAQRAAISGGVCSLHAVHIREAQSMIMRIPCPPVSPSPSARKFSIYPLIRNNGLRHLKYLASGLMLCLTGAGGIHGPRSFRLRGAGFARFLPPFSLLKEGSF